MPGRSKSLGVYVPVRAPVCVCVCFSYVFVHSTDTHYALWMCLLSTHVSKLLQLWREWKHAPNLRSSENVETEAWMTHFCTSALNSARPHFWYSYSLFHEVISAIQTATKTCGKGALRERSRDRAITQTRTVNCSIRGSVGWRGSRACLGSTVETGLRC